MKRCDETWGKKGPRCKLISGHVGLHQTSWVGMRDPIQWRKAPPDYDAGKTAA